MALGPIEQYARERRLSLHDASQAFAQVIVLKNLSPPPKTRLIGGTALVLGHGNPRFSEDIDLTGVEDPGLLRPGLARAASELGRWLGCPVVLRPPNAGAAKAVGRTWSLTCRMGRAESIRLHIDSQIYPAYSVHPIIVQYPSLPSFACEGVESNEIMADKILAIAYRNYLGGRDLFDLWFHWLRSGEWMLKLPKIREYLDRKLKDRSRTPSELLILLEKRLSPQTSLERARDEWKRYLPEDFQKKSVLDSILDAGKNLPRVLK